VVKKNEVNWEVAFYLCFIILILTVGGLFYIRFFETPDCPICLTENDLYEAGLVCRDRETIRIDELYMAELCDLGDIPEYTLSDIVEYMCSENVHLGIYDALNELNIYPHLSACYGVCIIKVKETQCLKIDE